MKKVYAPYLRVIQASVEAIEKYRPPDKETFLASPVLQDAVLMRLQVIGENLAQMRALDDEIFERQAADSWNQDIGLRHIILTGTGRSISRGFGRS